MTRAISSRAFVKSAVAEVDLAVARVQEAARDSLQRVIDGGLLKGRLVQNVTIGTSATQVSHGLGRKPVGWFVVDNTVSCDLYRTAWDDRTITLTSSASVTISIWVF